MQLPAACRASPAAIRDGFHRFRQLRPDAYRGAAGTVRVMQSALCDPASGVTWQWAHKAFLADGSLDFQRMVWQAVYVK